MRFAPIRFCRLAYWRRERAKLADLRWESINSVMALIGQTTIVWAGVERMLDELIAWYQHSVTNLEMRHPKNLADKLKYLKTMQQDDRLTSGMRAFLRDARIRGKALGNRRHDLIHGLMHRRSVRGDVWQSQRVIYDGPLARLTATAYSNEDFGKLLTDATQYASFLSPRVWVITQTMSAIEGPPDCERALIELNEHRD
jgi:hypothetical protein